MTAEASESHVKPSSPTPSHSGDGPSQDDWAIVPAVSSLLVAREYRIPKYLALDHGPPKSAYERKRATAGLRKPFGHTNSSHPAVTRRSLSGQSSMDILTLEQILGWGPERRGKPLTYPDPEFVSLLTKVTNGSAGLSGKVYLGSLIDRNLEWNLTVVEETPAQTGGSQSSGSSSTTSGVILASPKFQNKHTISDDYTDETRLRKRRLLALGCAAVERPPVVRPKRFLVGPIEFTNPN
ncbi:hypothetical protein QBC47DRAFT_3848 [Echria macrotheca]|uniref:Uncharacterized protein n=1 Tax=Echria macrotheca TaxID=438768 RepID=A0AAJ0BLU7_9PEZI|nr:hypothetical protein QBC47DRAFT_3848 [Echria macrotheca]